METDVPDHICTAPDCDRKHYARGMCAMHYHREYYRKYPGRRAHQKREMVCTQCGVTVWKYPAGKRKPFCSWACQLAHQKADQGHTWGRVRSTEVAIYVKPQPKPQVIKTKPPRWFVAGRCQVCGEPFVSRTTARTCSERCAEDRRLAVKREGKHRRRARQRDAYVAPVFRLAIYERDRWRCQICKRKVDRAVVAPHPKAPTLDHIAPLSQGGTHEPSNVRLACFLCNSTRGDRGGWEQLALIG